MEYIEQWDIIESEVSNADPAFPDTVKRIKYAFILYDVLSQGDENSFRFGEVHLPSPFGLNFKPFSELVHNDFVNFIKDTHGTYKIQSMIDDMVNEIESRKIIQPEIEIKTPWVTNEPVVNTIPQYNNQLEYLSSQTNP
jgi:hypothetical protein